MKKVNGPDLKLNNIKPSYYYHGIRRKL